METQDANQGRGFAPACTEAFQCEVRAGLSTQLQRAHARLRDEAEVDRTLDEAKAKVDQAHDEIVALKETNARLNRRCQAAESAALQNVKACAAQGLSFGRTLANWYALRLADELRLCLPLTEPAEWPKDGDFTPAILTGKTLAWLDLNRQRILRSLPDPADLERWRAKQVQPKNSNRDA